MLTSPFVLRHVLVLAAAALVAGTAGADVYKYTDEKGNVLYTDKPATLPAERMHVQSQKTDTVGVQARQQAEMSRMQQSDQARQASANKQSNDQQAAELNAKDKADRCAKARERYDKYMNSQKLYEQQEGGERRYLTSEELDAARASAKASMEVLCK
jgi:hypothetical protein